MPFGFLRRSSATGAADRERVMTLIMIYLAGIVERADESLLPAVYQEVGDALHVSPSGLGTLTLFRSIVQSLCYPLAAYMASRYNRTHVVAIGAFLWAAATSLVALSSTFWQVAISRGLNGIGLALVIPAIQSLVADSTEDSNRGAAFGWLQLTGNGGSIFGGMFALLLATRSFMGIPGWRIAFHLIAILSVVVGILVRIFAVDPNFSGDGDKKGISVTKKSFKSELRELFIEAKSVMKVPSFQVIVAQGVMGTFPWSALSFSTMWLELIGFSHWKTGLLMSLFSVAGSTGALFGGFMGDFLSKHYPNSGRIILSQISSASAVPIAAILLLALPDDPSSALAYALVLVIMGLVITWNGPGTNNPIFAEIVPERSRTSIYALDRSFESLLASFAPPVVGLLAENVYGYKPVPQGSGAGKFQADRENAASLAKALYTAISIPISLCCLIYTFLYFTYPMDKERARMDCLIKSELQRSELENGRAESPDVHLLVHSTQLEYKQGDKMGIMSGSSDGYLDMNDSDERRPLSHE